MHAPLVGIYYPSIYIMIHLWSTGSSERLQVRWICLGNFLLRPGDRNLKARPLIFCFSFTRGRIIFSIWNKSPHQDEYTLKKKIIFFLVLYWHSLTFYERGRKFDADTAHLSRFLWVHYMVFSECTSLFNFVSRRYPPKCACLETRVILQICHLLAKSRSARRQLVFADCTSGIASTEPSWH